MTVTPSSSIGSPNTFLTLIASRAPSINSSTLTISLSFELRFPLLPECLQALARILGREGEIEEAPLVLQAELERAFVGAVDRLLREAGCDRPFGCDVRREPFRLVEPRLGLDDARDQPG